MAIEDKVDSEMEYDRTRNRGQKKRKVLSIVARHGISTPITDEIRAEISEVLGHESMARADEWHRRAVVELRAIPAPERRKIGWTGSEEVTDLNDYRKTKEDRTAANRLKT